MENKNTNTIIYLVSAAIIAGLIFAGFHLIQQSNDAYQTSLKYTDKVFSDTTLKTKPVVAPNYGVIKDGYTESLVYFTLAVGVILLLVLLPRLQSINIGASGINIALKDLPKKLDDLAMQANAIQASSVGTGGIGKSSSETLLKREVFFKNSNPEYSNDPQKNKWGGKDENNGRRLSAAVEQSFMKGYYTVTLTIYSVDVNKPLKGLAKFHLHNSFSNPDPVIAVLDGKAILNLSWVYGAFTVGAETDEGDTKLELDLATLNLGPEFKGFLEN